MHSSSEKLERQAAEIAGQIQNGACEGSLRLDRPFGALLQTLRPRIQRLINQYGFADMREDAEQACAIGVFRALQSFNAAKAKFSTHVTWQLRGELQSLRHRVRLDQRQSAQAVGARTQSLDALMAEQGDGLAPFEVVDEDALSRTERNSSDRLVMRCLGRLMERIGAPAQEHVILLDALFDRDDEPIRYGRTREQRRQIVRRTFRNCAKVVADPALA